MPYNIRRQMPKDPICGMEVDEKNSKFSTAENNKKYYFCSKDCQNKFIKKYPKIKSAKTLSNIQKCTIPISGMHCATCAKTIEKALVLTQGSLKTTTNLN